MSFLGGSRGRTWRRLRSTIAPSVTYVLITVTLLVFLLQLLSSAVTDALLYAPVYSRPETGFPFEPWRLITVAFVHSPSVILHIAFNMLALWMFGQQLESAVGKWRFLAIYLLSALGGSVAVLYLKWNDPAQAVVGASGAVFGLLGAFFIIARKLGANTAGLVILIALNLGIGLFFRTISWQAHVGGLLAGALVAFVLVQTRRRNQQRLQTGLLIGVGAGLTLAGIAPAILG
ncbi:rhomboid family intramembrane serine protease [Naasia sp. SYSU D00057]|uniref:rhomboid family intramembrane serine protease n=1 Tax=Naasia sp. SYSU D00057 TaxID=2817380 RepID=UPI0027DCFB56|nr:rhomboid family intramembrane serine protease [Naasia sp. SYSU D00057]